MRMEERNISENNVNDNKIVYGDYYNEEENDESSEEEYQADIEERMVWQENKAVLK